MADLRVQPSVKIVDPTTNSQEAGVTASGELKVLVNSALPAGTNNIGDVDVLSLPASTNTLEVVGDVAHGSASGGNPLLLGAHAVSAEPSAVDTADVSRIQSDLTGKLIFLPYAIPECFLSGTNSATGTSNTEVIAAQGGSTRIYLTTLIIHNSSSTNTLVNIKDGTTTKLVIPAPANGGAVVKLDPPLRGTANTALNFASGSGVTTMYVSATGYKGV